MLAPWPEGDTVFVSGAAGAVGSAVGQIAKIKGCTAIGSAGNAEKVRHLVDDLGFDHAFDYHDGHLERQIRTGAPDGLDVYFDNVGGDHLQAALNCMKPNGRIPLCGAIAQYNATEPVPGPNNLTIAIGMQLTLQGFIVSNYNHLRDDFMRDMTDWVTKWSAQVPGDDVRRPGEGAGGVHRALHGREHRQDGRTDRLAAPSGVCSRRSV